MKVAIVQPYLFPYIGYFQLISAVDTFVIFDDVSYFKKGWINRNRILLNGTDHLFTFPLSGASQNKCINEIEVGNGDHKLLKTLSLAYRRSPFFSEIFEMLKPVISFPEKNLAKYLTNSMIQLSDYLGIRTDFVYSSEIAKNNGLKSQEKIIDICKNIGAHSYINPAGGVGLYNKEMFKSYNIDLFFLKTQEIKYQQFNNEFVSMLSIIDILMFNNVGKIKEYLAQYELN